MTFLSTPAGATDAVSFDGVWWTGLSDSEQVVAVEAIIAGFDTGYNDGYIRAALNDNAHYHSTRSTAQLTDDPETHQVFSKTFGAYQQEITDFYSAHTKSMTVTVGDVMACLSDDPQYTCDQVSKWIH